jgi:hypothetical protein
MKGIKKDILITQSFLNKVGLSPTKFIIKNERCSITIQIGLNGDDYIHERWTVIINGGWTKIKYVHELIYLIYVLTGDDLTKVYKKAIKQTINPEYD